MTHGAPDLRRGLRDGVEAEEAGLPSIAESLWSIHDRLGRAQVDSVVIGALAVAVWGEPRATEDIDLKVCLARHEGRRLVDILGPGFDYLGVDPVETLQRHALLFTRDERGTRIDFLLSESAFDHEAVGRGQVLELLPGVHVKVCTAEDLVVFKLISNRPRDLADAGTVVWRQRERLDAGYVVSRLRGFEDAMSLHDSSLVSLFMHMLEHPGELL